MERWIQEYKNNTELPSGVKTRKGDTILALKNLKKSFFVFYNYSLLTGYTRFWPVKQNKSESKNAAPQVKCEHLRPSVL